MSGQKPSPGRVVYFQEPSRPVPTPAVITEVNEDGTVNLALLRADRWNISMGGPEGKTPTAGCWSWPPRT